MKVAFWNVNSVRPRLPQILEWIKEAQPDVLCLQEIKCQDHEFPSESFEEEGLQCAVFGQKSYNGVAVLSKYTIEDVQKNNLYFPDEQSRILECVINGWLRVINVYVPNGQAIGTEKMDYKLDFFKAFKRYLKSRIDLENPLIIGGDFNVAPTPQDAHKAAQKDKDVLCSSQERKAFRELLHLGLIDTIREFNIQTKDLFSWWDYRSGSFQSNKGFRIDHILTSSAAFNSPSYNITDCGIDSSPRSNERPSDHAPVWIKVKKNT